MSNNTKYHKVKAKQALSTLTDKLGIVEVMYFPETTIVVGSSDFSLHHYMLQHSKYSNRDPASFCFGIVNLLG